MSSSRTSICIASVVALAIACGGKKGPPIAELAKADGPVDRQAAGQEKWGGAQVGTKFFLGDAARTADGGAQLVLAGTAQLVMQPHTILRFGGTVSAAKISVELGAVDLSGTGSYGLDVGKVTLAQNGAIRITAQGQGQSSLELLAGTAELAQDGGTTKLEIGQVLELGVGSVKVATVDAGVADAPPADAGVADAPEPTSDDAQVEVTGKHAEVQAPGETKWTPLPAGSATLAKGTKLRLGAATTAKLVANGTTLELGATSRATVSADLVFGLELGNAKATVPAKTDGKVGVPGGVVELKGTPTGPAVAKLDVNARGEAKVTMVRGGGKLDGAPGTTLDMALGETATLAKAGTIHPLEAIPTYFDFAVTAGESFTIHDPRGATALKVKFEGKCPNGGVLEVDHNAQFRTAKLSGGKDSANVMIPAGAWAYRVRCSNGDQEGAAIASGHIGEVRDDGRRPLPPKPGKNPIDADGRNYTISYQSLIPNVEVHYRGGAGGSFKLHLATGGAEETYDSSTPVVEVPGAKLKEATYTYWFDHDGVKQDKVSTLKITFDQTAPQVYIEAPPNGQPFGSEIDVRGAVLPGWSAKVEAFEIPIDKNTRRFAAKVPPPEGQALAIRLSHPQRGVHFYLRRGAAAK